MWKSTKLWTLYVDLEESLGTLESTKAVWPPRPPALCSPLPIPLALALVPLVLPRRAALVHAQPTPAASCRVGRTAVGTGWQRAACAWRCSRWTRLAQVYERMLDLKIATPQIIINFAHLLEENKYFEEVPCRPLPPLLPPLAILACIASLSDLLLTHDSPASTHDSPQCRALALAWHCPTALVLSCAARCGAVNVFYCVAACRTVAASRSCNMVALC